jgi:hypothetical protein
MERDKSKIGDVLPPHRREARLPEREPIEPCVPTRDVLRGRARPMPSDLGMCLRPHVELTSLKTSTAARREIHDDVSSTGPDKTHPAGAG